MTEEIKNAIISKWKTAIQVQDILNCTEFFHQKAKESWQLFTDYVVTTEKLEAYLKMPYETFKTSDDTKEIRDLIFNIVAYCDSHANEKSIRNQYDDKRTIVENSQIRQSAWVVQMLKYRVNPSFVSDSIRHLIDFINEPESHLPILSEEHRKNISFHILEEVYNPDSFDSQLIDAFDSLISDKFLQINKTSLYARVLYDVIQDKWNNISVKGLLTRDNTGWQSDFVKEVAVSGYGVMWKDQLSDFNEVVSQLRKLLDSKGSFLFYNIANNVTDYVWTVEDFATRESYKDVVDEWKEHNPAWFYDDFDDYSDENQHAKIVFLVSKAECTPAENRIDIKCFNTFKNKKASVKNAVAYTQIVTQKEKKEMEQIDIKKKLLEIKKNIILQGAPGTGKTYNTAALALSIIGVKDLDWSNHKDVMEKYRELLYSEENKNGQIGFCTFHQSMDYEDFVEGLKPYLNEENNDVAYRIEPGIFKILCDKARVASNKNYVLIVDEINRGNVSKIFGELISCLENDKRIGGDHRLDVLLPYSKKLFSVPGNLYIIGTMNTTDRSTGSIDYAIRRRFAFVTMRSDRSLVESLASPLALNLFDAVRKFIVPVDPTIDMEDLMVGHSYFFGDEANLPDRWKYEIYPLLVEYYKDGLIKHPPFAKGEDYCENMQAFIDKYNV